MRSRSTRPRLSPLICSTTSPSQSVLTPYSQAVPGSLTSGAYRLRFSPDSTFGSPLSWCQRCSLALVKK
jgi:hypothetical protein